MERDRISEPRKPTDAMVAIDGRDEMNLAEFPLACLGDRAPSGRTSLVFEDHIWDRGRAERITRRLTITASDKYGLPTALDDDVILGLIQVTKAKEFADRRVPFSRYQLIQILGWRDEGKSYRRLETSLKRWLGVTLYYEQAWWDRDQQSWVDESFHLLEHLVLYRRTGSRRKSPENDKERSPSSFTWNEVVFRSFLAGYLKCLDMDRYRLLKGSIAKRIYRFLDKRFYRRNRLEYDLRRFACEHVGLSRSYDVGQLKRRLMPSIRELEEKGFLVPMEVERRFLKIRRGEWKVVLMRCHSRTRAVTSSREKTTSERGLIDRGVSSAAAVKLCKAAGEDKISEKIELFDWHAEKGQKKKPGWLRRAIEEDYSPPDGFETMANRKSRQRAVEERRRREKKKREQEESIQK